MSAGWLSQLTEFIPFPQTIRSISSSKLHVGGWCSKGQRRHGSARLSIRVQGTALVRALVRCVSKVDNLVQVLWRCVRRLWRIWWRRRGGGSRLPRGMTYMWSWRSPCAICMRDTPSRCVTCMLGYRLHSRADAPVARQLDSQWS